ncbi:MAG: precorrin-4 C(11)-methyltransferase [Rikenellaceae bacterium]
MNKIGIVLTSQAGFDIAKAISTELGDAPIITTTQCAGATTVDSLSEWVAANFTEVEALIFVGAVGIAVRCIAPCVEDKHTDPAVVNIDSTGSYAVSLLSGHVGGANELTRRVAHIVGAEAVISTRSDNTNMWALDTLATKYGWGVSYRESSLNAPITTYVNGERVALLLEVRDRGTEFMERTKSDNVEVFYNFVDIDQSAYSLIIAVTPYLYPESKCDILYYHPRVLHLGVGCRRNCPTEGVAEYIESQLIERNISPLAIGGVATIELKKDEPLLAKLSQQFDIETKSIFIAEELADIEVPNPSTKVEEVTGSSSVSESSAILATKGGELIVEKQKGCLAEGGDFTFAVAFERGALRCGHIEIVGAGPGDPDLVSVRGRAFLENADLILYAGSLVPIELTHCAKESAVVRSSASMNLEEQFEIMKEFYDRGLLVVRLHTGDPCIYGAIQEQMAFFDEYHMSYHITPGISSFQAAAAALRSQFTIPERVQTIILTRGEGRTPMPDKEKLHLLARSQSTMCIFLSASIVDDIEHDLLEHYPPTTPVAACYKLTWKDEKIFRGELKDLAKIVKGNNLTLTTMIVVGDAIDNRQGLSKLYADSFKHLFRK